ncbi:glycine--tRNA ligase subunit beta [Qipengyuania huizhouensis]|uniref:glycine--tRNA ligase subunit beta n=1 Tax=Qipengyuania huizhouensis TaxID=2867245 RepID=UPI001C88E1DC|nr:glycine--tRNA ligase subunit beta [Qipengyuania huizhouensis]MBX7460465.1 glycine--tRNA ligase subunit beta [Qipengyuania huizhouensis]
MSDFLLELRSEEIPARMQAGARAELEKLFRREMEGAGISPSEVTVWSTPRRLALIARGLPEATQAVSEELKGPPVGAPDQALEGFCRKAGVDKADLQTRDVKGRATYFAVKNIPGRATRDLLAEAIPAIIRDFSWPKSMRWGAASISTESLRWVRPLSGIVALLGEELVECEVHGATSGWVTLGHRFHHSGDITIGSAADYAEKLRACHVIVDHEERQDLIRSGAAKVASEAGLKLVEDEGLVIENAGLTEWPVPLLGRFEEDFLEVPPETIQLTARVNQKYFVCEDDRGNLANAFICTANIEAEDGGARVVDGNRKVLAARLSDARFFWDVDRKKSLAEHAKGLERITFHEKLGTVADKVERVAKLARWLVEEGIVKPTSVRPEPVEGLSFTAESAPEEKSGASTSSARTVSELADMAEQAARLAKADLVTEMVGEFPELQGLMGGYYARAEGLPDAVAGAIRDHYKPVGQGDDVPTAPVTVALSLADKLDTLFGFFEIGELPTGSKDPFALRRAAIAVIRLVEANQVRALVSEIARSWSTDKTVGPGLQVEDFLQDRLGVMMKDAGVRYDVVQASTDLGTRLDGDVWRVRRRAAALQSFLGTEDGANLLAGYKRAANILKKEDWHGIEGEIAHTGEEDPLSQVDDPDMKAVIDAKMSDRHAKELSYEPEPAEKALMDALAKSEPAAAVAIDAEDFSGAMAALAALRAPIDRFFEEVTVNADEENKRAHRLDLLAAFRAAVHKVADFSRIEG